MQLCRRQVTVEPSDGPPQLCFTWGNDEESGGEGGGHQYSRIQSTGGLTGVGDPFRITSELGDVFPDPSQGGNLIERAVVRSMRCKHGAVCSDTVRNAGVVISAANPEQYGKLTLGRPFGGPNVEVEVVLLGHSGGGIVVSREGVGATVSRWQGITDAVPGLRWKRFVPAEVAYGQLGVRDAQEGSGLTGEDFLGDTMPGMFRCMLLALVLVLRSFGAEDAPSVKISNKAIQATVLLPDSVKGYYRGTRFDWSGAISSLRIELPNGTHELFGKWFEKYEPTLHDAIQGPVEEFGEIGYATAPVGGRFLKPGVGWLKRPDEKPYDRFRTYTVEDGGSWKVRRSGDSILFEQTLTGTYVYRKVLRLVAHGFSIEHELRNLGKSVIDTDVYNHNFYMLDGRKTGPEFVVRFPFVPRPDRENPGLVVEGKELHYAAELEAGKSTYGEFSGFGSGVEEYDIRVESRTAGFGVRQVGDRALSKLVFWSIPSTVCPEAYVRLQVKPGEKIRWKITYEVYPL